jgi:hypothetical protein
LIDKSLQAINPTGSDNDVRTGLGKSDRDVMADTAGCSSNECSMSRKIE